MVGLRRARRPGLSIYPARGAIVPRGKSLFDSSCCACILQVIIVKIKSKLSPPEGRRQRELWNQEARPFESPESGAEQTERARDLTLGGGICIVQQVYRLYSRSGEEDRYDDPFGNGSDIWVSLLPLPYENQEAGSPYDKLSTHELSTHVISMVGCNTTSEAS